MKFTLAICQPVTPQLPQRPTLLLVDCQPSQSGPQVRPSLSPNGQTSESHATSSRWSFQYDTKIRTFLKDLPWIKPVWFYGKHMNAKQQLFGGWGWEDMSICLSHKALNCELMGVNHSSLWDEQWRRICFKGREWGGWPLYTPGTQHIRPKAAGGGQGIEADSLVKEASLLSQLETLVPLFSCSSKKYFSV